MKVLMSVDILVDTRIVVVVAVVVERTRSRDLLLPKRLLLASRTSSSHGPRMGGL